MVEPSKLLSNLYYFNSFCNLSMNRISRAHFRLILFVHGTLGSSGLSISKKIQDKLEEENVIFRLKTLMINLELLHVFALVVTLESSLERYIIIQKYNV